MDKNLKIIFEGVLEGDMDQVTKAVEAALNNGIPASEILQTSLIPDMGEVGRYFEEGEYFVPEMLIAARAMKAGLAIIKPMLVESGIEPSGKVVYFHGHIRPVS